MSDGSKETLAFIDDYRSLSVLWDSRLKNYTNKQVRKEALTQLGEKYNLDVKGVKNKIKSLRSYFSKEHTKVTKNRTGFESNEVYTSPWFGYEPLLFILDSLTARETKESEETPQDDSHEHEISSADDMFETVIIPELSLRFPPEAQSQPDRLRPLQNKRHFIKKKQEDNDPREEETYKMMKLAATQITENDEAGIFGQIVAAKIRKFSPRNRAVAENQIQNFLFQIEMQEMGHDTENNDSD